MNYIGKTVYVENTTELISVDLLKQIEKAFENKFCGPQEISTRAIIEEKTYLAGVVVGTKNDDNRYNNTVYLLVKLTENGNLVTVKSDDVFLTEPEKETEDAAGKE